MTTRRTPTEKRSHTTHSFLAATQSGEDCAASFDTDLVAGYRTEQATARLQEHGRNELATQTASWMTILKRQFQSPFILLLFVAAGIAAALGEVLDGIVIAIFVSINAGLGFSQEYRSERALRMLREFVVSRSHVIRDGQEQAIDSRDIVPGDLVVVETGDVVPADLRLTSIEHFRVDEETLTGESIPVVKGTDALATAPADLFGAPNLAFSGTTVVEGRGVGIAIATGGRTIMGETAALASETEKESVFAKGIDQFSRFILRLILLTLVAIFIANIVIKGGDTNIIELVVFSIALAVSVIPEALPVVTTVSLTRGALELAHRGVVVRRLSAIEDIGSIDVLCTDKTGTLTENTLTVAGTSPGSDPALIASAALAASDESFSIEPFDVALWTALPDADQRRVKASRRVHEIPFDPTRKRNSVVVATDDGRRTLFVRGAPEVVLARCRVDEHIRTTLQTWLTQRGTQGQRALAVARTTFDGDETRLPTDDDERDLELVGIVAFTDPVKPSAVHAVTRARQQGLRIVIITGDSADVAGAVAQQLGLTNDPGEVMLGSAFIALNPAQQRLALDAYHVFARVTPEEKHALVNAFEQRYDVGFLGEGINDAPALKAAGVSLVVQSASDVAREVADIVLLHNDLGVIVDGVEHGRRVFANTVKYLKATLASNFGNFYAIAIGSLLITFLPMLPLQILLVNLLSDFPMISIATDSIDPSELKRPRKYRIRDVVYIATILGIVSTVFDFMFFALYFREAPAVLQTNWFIGSILTELAFLFSIRTRLPWYRAVRPSRVVLWLSGLAAATTILIPYTPFGQAVFRFHPPSVIHLATICTLVVTYFLCSESVKLLYYRHASHDAHPID